MDDNLKTIKDFYNDYYKLFCKVDKQAKNLDTDNLDIALKAASKSIGLDIPPIRKEDMGEEIQKTVSRGIEKIYNKTHKKSPKVEIDMKDDLEITMKAEWVHN